MFFFIARIPVPRVNRIISYNRVQKYGARHEDSHRNRVPLFVSFYPIVRNLFFFQFFRILLLIFFRGKNNTAM